MKASSRIAAETTNGARRPTSRREKARTTKDASSWAVFSQARAGSFKPGWPVAWRKSGMNALAPK